MRVKDLDIEEIFLEETVNEDEVLNLDFSRSAFEEFDKLHSIKLCVIIPFDDGIIKQNVTFTELGVGQVGVGGENRIYINENYSTDIYDYSIIFDNLYDGQTLEQDTCLMDINFNRPRSEVKKDIMEKYKDSNNNELIEKFCDMAFSPETMKKSLEAIDKIIDKLKEKNA